MTKIGTTLARFWGYRQQVGRMYLVVTDAIHTWDNGHRGLLTFLALFKAIEVGSWLSFALIALDLALTATLIVQMVWGATKHLQHFSRNLP